MYCSFKSGLVALILAGSMLTGCSEDKGTVLGPDGDGGGNGSSQLGQVTARIGGVNRSFVVYEGGPIFGSMYVIALTSMVEYPAYGLSFVVPIQEGEYRSTVSDQDEMGISFSQINGPDDEEYGFSSDENHLSLIRVTDSNPEHFQGTFSGVLYDEDSGSTISVESGSFQVDLNP